MPCASFSTPAQACITGSKLAKIAGSVCHGCYALKGNYRFKNVLGLRENNLRSLGNLDTWVLSMIKLIKDDDVMESFVKDEVLDSVTIWQPFEDFDLIDLANCIEITRNDFLTFAEKIKGD